MDSLFYSAFEAQFRGNRELIENRLNIYKNILNRSDGVVIDLGCGRGEWLSLLRQWGINATGIDSDSEMVKICRDYDLNVINDDIFIALDKYEDNSIGVISAIHVIEHLPFNMVIQLLNSCKRVLKSGGIIILETPNSENILVSSSEFFLDPTHLKPIPAKLLNFAAEYCGFQNCTVLRINSSVELPSQDLSLYNAFAGVGPDYALIAISGENAAISHELAEMQSKHKGYSFDITCAEYEKSYSSKLDNIFNQTLDSIQNNTQQINELRNSFAVDLNNFSDLFKQLIDDSNNNNTQQVNELKNSFAVDLNNSSDFFQRQMHTLWLHCVENSREISSIKTSFSWKLTAPLRFLAKSVRKVINLLFFRIKSSRFTALLSKDNKKIDASTQNVPLKTLLYRDAENLWDSRHNKLNK